MASVYVALIAVLVPMVITAERWPSGSLTDVLLGSCELTKHTYLNAKTRHALRRIQPLIGKRFTVTEPADHQHHWKSYIYDVGICTQGSNRILDNTQPREDKDWVTYDVAAVLQYDSHRPNQPPDVLGAFNETEIMAGSDWVSLTYSGGDRRRHKCSDKGRRSIIMITCDPQQNKGDLQLLEENFNKTDDCYYLFELQHRAVCPSDANAAQLSPGDIICIVLACGLFLLLIIGCIVNRYYYKAQGMAQVPGFGFLEKCGCPQDDPGLICRCGNNQPIQYDDVSVTKATGKESDVMDCASNK